MADAFVCEGLRTPIGRYGGALAAVRTDDLAAHVLSALHQRFSSGDWEALDEVVLGCANQSGEDNRNIARMALLLAGLPHTVPGCTVNRLCASGMEAIAAVHRAIRADEMSLAIAGGVESMSRAPMVIPKATAPFSRHAEIHDTTLGWRFINPKMQQLYGTDSMGETAENVAEAYHVSRSCQDAFALRSQQRAATARTQGVFEDEIVPVEVSLGRGVVNVASDEHPRPDATLDQLGKLATSFRKNGTVTAGNSSGINDGACAMLIASEDAARRFGLTPIARIAGCAAAGVEPKSMGIGPVPATRKLLSRLKLDLSEIDWIEINEAFAAQVLAVIREFGLEDDSEKVNPHGGAIALGHPLGMSGARLVLTSALQLRRTGARYALATMCVGVGQGMAMVLERV